MARLYRFLVDVHPADLQGLPIFLDEELGLFPGPKVEVALSGEYRTRPSQQVLSGAIDPHEPQRLTVLDEQHEGNVLDDRVEEHVGIPELFLDALALGDVVDLRDVVERHAGGDTKERRAEHDVDDGPVLTDAALFDLVP